ncbi:MAG: DUF4175 domain-containing protein [Alphaproteobacteria bacterium]
MHEKNFKPLDQAKTLTRLSLLLEKLSACFWPLGLWVLFIASLLLLQIPFLFGSFGSLAFFYIFWAGVLYFFIKGALRFRWPDAREIDRRIEERNHYSHTPLSVYGDTLANPDKRGTRLLWQEVQDRLRNLLARVRPGHPRAFIVQKDPYALRAAICLLFLSGLLIAGDARWSRLSAALQMPSLDGQNMKGDVELWITPPEYTGIAQITPARNSEQLQIPIGSMIKASVQGGIGRPVLKMGDKTIRFKKFGDGNYTLEAEISNGNALTVQQLYLRRGTWKYRLVPDLGPQIAKAEAAEILEDGAIRFSLDVNDDYGISTLTMRMTLGVSMTEAPRGSPIEELRIVTSPPNEKMEINPVYDLTWHGWAGLPVQITFEVTDSAGHTAILDPQTVTLPERTFNHPVAQEIIRIRKELIGNKNPDTLMAARKIETLMTHPYYFKDDIVIFMSLRAASSRLLWSPPTDAVLQSVISLLWSTALRIEDGNLTVAQMSLRDAKAALEKALADPNVSQDEIARLTDDLRNAMNEYLIELQKAIAGKMAQGGQILQVPEELMKQLLSPGSIAGMLDQLQADMQAGNRRAAQQMLSKLGNMLDFLNPSLVREMPEDIKMMAEGLNILQQLIEAQQTLYDQTKLIEARKPAPQEHAVQHDLKGALEKMNEAAKNTLKDYPPKLDKAAREMGEAVDYLKHKQAPTAAVHQEIAINDLKKAKEELNEQLNARLQQMTGMSFGANGMRFDPLGRPIGNGQGLPDSDVKIPDAAERREAQEILEILRQRAGENRPEIELEYYRRLLKLF